MIIIYKLKVQKIWSGSEKKNSLVFSTKSIQSIYRLKMDENLTFLTQAVSQSKIFDGR